jgi:hypothetical protein
VTIDDRLNNLFSEASALMDELRGEDRGLAVHIAFNHAKQIRQEVETLTIFSRRWLNDTHHTGVQQPVFVPIVFPSEGVTRREKNWLQAGNIIKEL